MKRIFIILLIALSLGCAKQDETSVPTVVPTTAAPTTQPPVTTPPPTEAPVPEEIKTTHFIDSVPYHMEVFATVPKEVIINFGEILKDTSKITVYHEEVNIASSETIMETRMIGGSIMKTVLDPQYGDGEYIVEYEACQAGGLCNDGKYSFTVDSLALNNYVDMTGRAYVEIEMVDNRFNPQNVIISIGTRVKWANKEKMGHFVKSNPFKSQNYLLPLGSNLLSKYNYYEYTFSKTGEFPYHCSLHYPDGMVGRILVK